jgi:TM2 domain-containing membrane protein YozV
MEKRHISALLSGLVFPGAGQFYNNHRLKGLVYVVVTVVCIAALVFVVLRDLFRALESTMNGGGLLWDAAIKELGSSRGPIVLWVLILAVSWIASIVDAYVAAGKGEGGEITRFISRKG